MVELLNRELFEQVMKEKPSPIIEGAEEGDDLSYSIVQMNEDLQYVESGIPVINFKDHWVTRPIESEFQLLRRLTENDDHSVRLREKTPLISSYNRYQNVLPYLHTEVSVPLFKNEDNEQYKYINANYINTPLGDQKYFIATQGPTLSSFPNFWKMIWHQKVELLIMLCNFKEKAALQCDHYFPCQSDNPAKFEFPTGDDSEKDIKVSFISESFDEDNGLYYRKLLIQKNNDNFWESRELSHIQWINWPDHGVPTSDEYSSLTILFYQILNHYISKKDSKVLLHCSAGIGRTGTLLAIFNLLISFLKFHPDFSEAMKNNGDVSAYKLSVFAVVRRLREQRWAMVNTSEQYELIYKFVSDFISEKIELANI